MKKIINVSCKLLNNRPSYCVAGPSRPRKGPSFVKTRSRRPRYAKKNTLLLQKFNNLQLTLIRRPFLMLEVLIAFALIVLCALPLIYPHIGMIKAQKELINKSSLNHFVNLQYVTILEKLHRNEIPLNDIENGKIFSIDQENLKEIPGYKVQGYTATFQFIKQRHKARNDQGFTVYLATLQLKFTPKKGDKPLSYEYEVFFGSKKQIAANDEEEKGREKQDDEKQDDEEQDEDETEI